MLFRGHAMRWICSLALLIFAGLAVARPATASTIYTFAFEQSDYAMQVNPSDAAGKISGTFSGTLDGFGHISKTTLTNLEVAVSGFTTFPFLNGSYTAIPSFFDYNPGDSSSFGIVATMGNPGGPPAVLCVGFPVAISCSGGALRGLLISNVVGAATTNSAMHVTLVAQTPIPAGLPLFLTALLGLGLLRTRRR